MELSSLSVEIILSHSHSVLGHLSLQGNPQPGGYLEFEGQTYLVLERRHHYQFKSGRYQMSKIALYVQKFNAPADVSLVNGQEIRLFLAKRLPFTLGEGERISAVSQRGSQNCRDFTLKPRN